jgi:hypothetical protein
MEVLQNSDPIEFQMKIAYVDWRKTRFWKLFEAIAYTLPAITLITLTTNHLIQIRKDVIKQHRYANDPNRFTISDHGGGSNFMIEKGESA